uniref:Stress-induced-phosphoprotein 1 n=1 Tax=Phallusia mammillata TaxID=59560 RepID=A0A6F9DUJ5_9ASCI|nr:stress-induced-phosphoprotein 1 [Phallusia mammillata]
MSEQLKNQGNQALRDGKVKEAIGYYSKAIEADPKNHVLYSNRSAAYAKDEDYLAALKDAETVIEIKQDWPKGYSRKGSALEFLNRYEEAKMCYEEGLKHDPNNEQFKSGITQCESHLTGPAGSQPMNPFSDLKGITEKLRNNTKTKDFFKDPSYLRMLEDLHRDPKCISQKLGDPRFQTTLSAILGFDFEMANGSRDEPMDTSPAPSNKPEKKAKPEKPKLSNNEEAALEEKALGNAAYKMKDFEEALKHYQKACELDPKNMTFLTNIAAVYFEQNEMEKCREVCQKAVDVGRENRAEYAQVAKAFGRIGNSYLKEKDYKNAIFYYNKSLSENRTKDTLTKLQQCEKAIADAERLAYINPELALEEKAKGNELYKKGKYPEALKCYSEAIKRDPDNAALYSNRAACYMKLLEFRIALKDCDECVKKDPQFIKGHVRRGGVLEAMKEFSRATDAYQKALDIDPNNSEASDGMRRCLHGDYKNRNNPEEVQKRAMNDPEVMRIMKDPAMKMILDQIQNDPRALQEHLKNPEVARNIQKLLDVGILSVR